MAPYGPHVSCLTHVAKEVFWAMMALCVLSLSLGFVANPRKLEHGFRRISARIPFILPEGHEDTHVPTFWLLL